MNILQIMRMGPVIPVIVVNDLEHAVPIARALVAGGVRVLEMTLRTPVALRAIERVCSEVEGAIVGVGTITRPEEVAASVKAGATFGVSPGVAPTLIAACHDNGLPLLPGVMTPSEVIAARLAGFTALKLFPAQQAGGIGMLRALSGPFPDVTFCPTGGISASTAADFLALPNVACVGGSWLTSPDLIQSGDWSAITELACQATALARNQHTTH